MSERSTPLKGELLVDAGRVLTLDSRFFGESDEYSDKWRYHDSDIYRKGPWVQDLLRFKNESNDLIEIARARSQLATKQDPAVLKAMRDKSNLPAVVRPPESKETKLPKPEVRLRIALRMRQRNEHPPDAQLFAAHIVLHDRVSRP